MAYYQELDRTVEKEDYIVTTIVFIILSDWLIIQSCGYLSKSLFLRTVYRMMYKPFEIFRAHSSFDSGSIDKRTYKQTDQSEADVHLANTHASEKIGKFDLLGENGIPCD
jgi:hypothetical protein